MNTIKKILSLNILILFLCGCDGHHNLTADEGEVLDSLVTRQVLDELEQAFHDVIYVPIYSDIYFDTHNPKDLLSATVSIRNTSFADSLWVNKIDYYDTHGSLVRNYISNPLLLTPMASVNYVVEKEDELGGNGANFIIELTGKAMDLKPIVQAVMIGHNSNKGYAFTVDGYSIK